MLEENQNLSKTLLGSIKSYFINLDKKKTILAFFIALIFSSIYSYSHRPPEGFPLGQIITISSGESLQTITMNLYNAHVIRYPFVFRAHVILLGGERRVKAGDYLLDSRSGPADLAYRFVWGNFHLKVIKITIPEGWNVFEIADYLSKNLFNFNKSQFLSIAEKQEGYLFPDTYFIYEASKPNEIINLMRGTFDEKIQIAGGIATTTYKLKDLIIMASIVEDEARTTESRRIIAGILWRRLKLGMPLQVDSTFSYINGKGTFDLTQDDLKIDSPYNTYEYRGLPPGPINNPGLDAINATLNPITTKYLYFLSSKSGTMYYATTFEEHKKNRELYLNK